MIAAAFGFLTSKIGRYALIVGGVLLAIVTIFQRGKKAARDAQERKNLEEYQDVRERVDEAVRHADGDTRDADERLRDHGALRD